MDEFIGRLIQVFVKWQDMSIAKRIPRVRAVHAARLLCKSLLQELPFDDRYDRIWSALKDMPQLAWPKVKVHWQDRKDGTKWFYFCKADPARDCKTCFQREVCDQ